MQRCITGNVMFPEQAVNHTQTDRPTAKTREHSHGELMNCKGQWGYPCY
jgi:hypothetical protein